MYLPIFIIFNITLQITDYGVLHKSSKHFMISIFFPPVEGDTGPLPVPVEGDTGPLPVPPRLIGTSYFEQ